MTHFNYTYVYYKSTIQESEEDNFFLSCMNAVKPLI